VQATPNTLRFLGASGYFTDATTGSLSVRRRMFQPDLARWLSSDPVIADTLNRYTYCFNSPVNIVDPSGMCVVCDIVPEFAGTFEELDAKFVAGQTPHRLAGRAWQFIYDNEEEWNRREMQPIKITGAGAYHSSTRGVTLDGRRYPPSAIQSYSYLFYLVAYVKSALSDICLGHVASRVRALNSAWIFRFVR
jgi:RHS repeat-associated protein